MKKLGLRDIIGPIMVGPSSSHTAGALAIAAMARSLCEDKPRKVRFRLLGSFAHTYHGHGTDKALVAGMLGFNPDDPRVRSSFGLADRAGLSFSFDPDPRDTDIAHPNTIDIQVRDAAGNEHAIRGESIGGGAARITRLDGVEVSITGEHTSVVVRQRDEAGVLAHIANCISKAGVNIATARMYREGRGEVAYTVLETDQVVDEPVRKAIEEHPLVLSVRVIPADGTAAGAAGAEGGAQSAGKADERAALSAFDAADFASGEELLRLCEAESMSISSAFLLREQALECLTGTPGDCPGYLRRCLEVMRESAHGPLDAPVPSMGGLLGGQAMRLDALSQRSGSIASGAQALASVYALAVLETNASMGRIVAAPTAGSSGVVPGVLLALQEEGDLGDAALASGLACAAAVGYLVTRNATVSGAEGGCQAEVGTACAMAAAAACELSGGSPEMCLNAAANALASMLGLVCDPVAGLVEVPCQKRNATAAAMAITCADMALAGIGNLVGFDEAVGAMLEVGTALPFELRESALGGLAGTPSACAFCETIRSI